MIEDKNVLAIIPARGGSKGLPRKNIRKLAGKPLIGWTIEEAKKSRYIDRLILSSEDSEIIEVAKALGCEVPFVRPAELARDNTPGIDPVLHAINTLTEQYHYVILLQPTSPLRRVEDIDGCLEHCLKARAPACVTVAPPDKSPYWMYVVNQTGRLQPLIKQVPTFTCRQDLPRVYAINGAVYAARCNWLLKNKTFITDETVAYIMLKERSLDVDTEFDFKLCQFLLKVITNKKRSYDLLS